MHYPKSSPDAYRSLVGLRAVRVFREEPLFDGDLEAVLEAARWTGSSKNTQPWAMVVVREGRERLAECGDFTGPVRAAPAVVVLVRRPGGGDFDIGRLAQNLMLGAAAVGVASCPVTLHHEDRAREVLGVPSDHGCRYAVTLGYSDEERFVDQRRRAAGWLPQGRRPLAELVFQERFGA
ncbi:MAG: nitroreductase family protein [Acidimicrobiia bacterium]